MLLRRALQQGQKICLACFISLDPPGVRAEAIAVSCSNPLQSTYSANCSVERMGSSGMQNLESSSVVYTEAGVSRVCVMEVEAVNSADVGLQVIKKGTREALSDQHTVGLSLNPWQLCSREEALMCAPCRCGWADV